MSIKRLDMYTAVCDWPGCSQDVMDPTEYSGWGEIEHVNDTLDDHGWWRDRDGERHYCGAHRCEWASDHEDGEPFPEPPYLLIHDGDTPDLADDGMVTLVNEVTA